MGMEAIDSLVRLFLIKEVRQLKGREQGHINAYQLLMTVFF